MNGMSVDDLLNSIVDGASKNLLGKEGSKIADFKSTPIREDLSESEKLARALESAASADDGVVGISHEEKKEAVSKAMIDVLSRAHDSGVLVDNFENMRSR